MVLIRRKDKRRGNADDELTVASDSSIVANKGVRSLQSARSGRFAADMRANVGGYGRPDKTWGVDHPWHTTEQSDLYSSLCARDHMEDGVLAREQELEREAARGASRAALKKRKAKLKKQGLSAQEAAAIAAKEAEEAKRRHEEEARLAAEEAQRKRAAKKGKHKRKQEAGGEDTVGEGEGAEKEKEKEEKKKGADTAAETEESAESKAKSKKKQKQKLKKQQAKKKAEEQAAAAAAAQTDEDAVDDVGEKTVTPEQEVQTREALAKQYEAAIGGEITTKSGLVIQDQRLGHGKLADIGEMLTVRYRGRLGKDGMVFGKGMLTTRYGTGSVIAGWEEGLGTMRPGGVRLLTIPPELGYGASGKGGKIPPNSTLFFEVELIRFGKRKRDAVGEDDIPLPSAFQRKKIKQKSGKKPAADGDADGPALSKSQKKRNRRKHHRPAADAA